MTEVAKLELNGEVFELPIITGTENEKAIDISKLRALTGYITLDYGYKNTGSTMSGITFLDGEKGILRYRGYPIEQLADKASFLEVAFLLIYGYLPDEKTFNKFDQIITHHTLVDEDTKRFLEAYPTSAHPMGIVASLVSSLSTWYPGEMVSQEDMDLTIARLLAKVPTISAWSYKNHMGHPMTYPQNNLSYVENFLHMMFAMPTEQYHVNPVVAKALNTLLILHADHEQNCSTSTVRIVGSSHANLYSSISAGIDALWGPLHGGANQAVIEMLQKIDEDGGDYQKWMNKAKDKDDPFRLMGFGHRVYKNFDPRAVIIKKAADEVLEALNIDDPLLDIAKGLEEIALRDEYFIQRKLYPNVDFYSGIIYKALNIPVDMFTVMFALGRLPGWIAQWKEMRENEEPIGRPRQIYNGANVRDFVPMKDR
jgi:citrate synthase